MKLRIADRIIAAVTGIILLAGCAAVAATVFFGMKIPEKAAALLSDTSLKVRGPILLVSAVAAVIGIYCILVLFRHRKRCDKFVSLKTEDGEITIAGKTIEDMIARCTDQHEELNINSIRLKNEKNGLRITLRGKVSGGVSIPLTISALQKQIRQYVTACSGLEVKEILFRIDGPGGEPDTAAYTVDTPSPAPQAVVAETNAVQPTLVPPQEQTVKPDSFTQTEMPEIPADEQDDERPLHQRIFCAADEPCIVPPPPAADPEQVNEENGSEDVNEYKDEPEKDHDQPETEGKQEISTETEGCSAEDEEPEAPAEQDDTNRSSDAFSDAQELFDNLITEETDDTEEDRKDE